MRSINLYEPRSSAGFGGIGPEVMISRFWISAVFIRPSPNSALPERNVDSPIELLSEKTSWSFALLISASIIMTFTSDFVRLMAVLIAVVVLPSSLAGLVTIITLGGFPPVERSRNVLMELYASEMGFVTSERTIYSAGRFSLLSPKFGTSPSGGRDTRFSISSGVLIVLLRYSVKNARPMPPRTPTIIDNM